jgi:Outer membrane lipoprotein-sorting protein
VSQRTLVKAGLNTVFVLTLMPSSFADPRGEELINRYLGQSARRDAILTMNVAYQEPEKEAVQLDFTWMRKLKQGVMSHLIRIESPPSQKGKLLLVREKANGAADYIAYRPSSALKKKVKVSGARNYKYKGLTISVQELIGGEFHKYSHESKGAQSIGGISCDVVESQLKPEFRQDSNYPHSVCYLRKDNGMLLKWELFGQSNKLEKVATAEEIKQIEGFWTVTLARVDDLKKGGKLTLRLKEAHYNPQLEDDLFSEEYLKENSQ